MIRLFRIRGIPVRVDAGWFVVVALIGWSLAVGYFPRVVPMLSPVGYWVGGLVAALLLFASVLVHELAHALVARAHGVGVAGITLHVFGGVSEFESDPPSPPAEVLIAAVGPLTSLGLAMACFATRQSLTGTHCSGTSR